jgi:hypothetical protein
MRLRVLALAAGLLWPVSALSQQPIETTEALYDGNRLYEMCVAQDIVKKEYCRAYISGMTDAFNWDRFVCNPKHTTEGQVRDVVLNYLRDHPETRHYSAPSLARQALSQAFPCK